MHVENLRRRVHLNPKCISETRNDIRKEARIHEKLPNLVRNKSWNYSPSTMKVYYFDFEIQGE